MNCHGNHDNNGNGHGKGRKGHLSHMLMMALCCGAPMLILLLVPFLTKIGGGGAAKYLTWIAPFICPLMMVFMLPMMFRGGKEKANKGDCCTNKQVESGESTPDNHVI